MSIVDELADLKACSESIKWIKSQDGTRQELWERCHRVDWMMWLLQRRAMDVDWAAMALELAEAVEHLSPEAAKCNAVTRRYLAGEASREELLRAADAAAHAAAYAAHAAHAACAAAYAAHAAADAEAQKMANIVRRYHPNYPTSQE